MPKGYRQTLCSCNNFTVSSGSCGDLIDEPPEVSQSGLFNSVPSCLHLPWFGDRGKEKEEVEQNRQRLRSVSSSSLPHLATADRRDQVRTFFCCYNGSLVPGRSLLFSLIVFLHILLEIAFHSKISIHAW